MLPITFCIIWLVSHRPHAKYTRTIYPYIISSFNYSDPIRPCSRGFTRTWVGIKLSTVFAEVIIVWVMVRVRVAVQRATPPFPPMIRVILTSFGYHILDLYNFYLVTWGVDHVNKMTPSRKNPRARPRWININSSVLIRLYTLFPRFDERQNYITGNNMLKLSYIFSGLISSKFYHMYMA